MCPEEVMRLSLKFEILNISWSMHTYGDCVEEEPEDSRRNRHA